MLTVCRSLSSLQDETLVELKSGATLVISFEKELCNVWRTCPRQSAQAVKQPARVLQFVPPEGKVLFKLCMGEDEHAQYYKAYLHVHRSLPQRIDHCVCPPFIETSDWEGVMTDAP